LALAYDDGSSPGITTTHVIAHVVGRNPAAGWHAIPAVFATVATSVNVNSCDRAVELAAVPDPIRAETLPLALVGRSTSLVGSLCVLLVALLRLALLHAALLIDALLRVALLDAALIT